jgi:thymidylate synthase ThyX
MEVEFPRMILAEFNTHRVFSRNSASSRAIPFAKQLARIEEDPFIPAYWGANQPGMQAEGEIASHLKPAAVSLWLEARDNVIHRARTLHELGVHKQTVNRLLEPFMWHRVLVTSTEWENFFALRANPMAQPEIRTIAEMMQTQYRTNQPRLVRNGEWHLPLLQPDESFWVIEKPEMMKKVSAARCARVSYLTHDGKRDFEADLQLYDRLVTGGHLSPLEHVATPNWENTTAEKWSGNFKGWKQLRKSIPHEHNFSLVESTS